MTYILRSIILGLFFPLSVCSQSWAQDAVPFATALGFEETPIYYPENRPGYVAWVGIYDFGNGDLGISFDQIRRRPNPRFVPMSIEWNESSGKPYLYGRTYIPATHPDLLQEGVYLISTDGGRTWEETGRCWGKTTTSMAAFPDGRMVRAVHQQGHYPEMGRDRQYTSIEESKDGGNTWKQIARLLDGKTFVPRIRKLRDGSLIAMGPISPSWGPYGERFNNDLAYDGERSLMQVGFMYSEDGGYNWTGPHYVLHGITAWEPDFIDLPDGRLLVLNCGVQMGAGVRQFVHRIKTGFVCDPIMNIQRGTANSYDVQSGFVPEAIDVTPDGMLIGARRGREYACSNDFGLNWYKIADTPNCGYQPKVEVLPDGRFMAAWHHGTDSAFGQQDMYIGLHSFQLDDNLPAATTLTLRRMQSPDQSQYINAFAARLMGGGTPIPDKTIELRLKMVWRDDGTYNSSSINETDNIHTAVTDRNGVARFTFKDFDSIYDIHFGYKVQASFTPRQDDGLSPCKSGSFSPVAMTSKRNTPYAYPVYFSENVLFLAKPTAEKYPELVDLLDRFHDLSLDLTFRDWADAMGGEKRAKEIIEFLVENNALIRTREGAFRWYRAVHCGAKVIEYVRVNDLPDYSS